VGKRVLPSRSSAVAAVRYSIFRRSMSSDLIRGWKQVRRRKCDQQRTKRSIPSRTRRPAQGHQLV
jgi:hypothetical protein